jgi:hypothetical protein
MNVMGGGKSPFCRADGSFASGNHPFALGSPSFYEAAHIVQRGRTFYLGWTLFIPDGLRRLALENHLLHGRRRETVSDKAQ